MTTPMPAAFLGHGSPMQAIESNQHTEVWRKWGQRVPRPRAILVVSAHWYINGTAVTAMAQPRTIHDFGGFPQRLFDVRYPAPGSPHLAAQVAELLQPTPVALDHTQWGLDHGTWSLLVHAFPKADIPVVQLSLDARQPFDFHLDMGARLHPLRADGILILGSGNIVHNLRALEPSAPHIGRDWAHRFDDAARALATGTPTGLVDLQHHPDFKRAVPTPEHFLPLLYIAGLARAAGNPLQLLDEGYDMGSLSMTSYSLA